MIGTTELIVAFAWTFCANGFLIPPSVPETLPGRWLEPVAAHTQIVFHDHDDWAMAFYLPPEPALTAGEVAAGRLFLFAPYYLAPGGLRDTSTMPVDVAENYFHALLEAAVGGSAYAASVEIRADALMPDVPEPYRLEAYLAAAADFGAHALSIANDVHRIARRQAAAGRDICHLLEEPASLFGLWQRSFARGVYRGLYPPPPGSPEDSPPRWQMSRTALERQDKTRFVREVLGSSWTGDAARDFARLCSAPDQGG